MKRLFNLILACLLIVSLSACGKQTGTDSPADKVSEQDRQAESVEQSRQNRSRQQYRKPHRLRQKRKMI